MREVELVARGFQDMLRARAGMPGARSHCRFVLLLIHLIDSLTYSVPLFLRFLKRQCDRTIVMPGMPPIDPPCADAGGRCKKCGLSEAIAARVGGGAVDPDNEAWYCQPCWAAYRGLSAEAS